MALVLLALSDLTGVGFVVSKTQTEAPIVQAGE